MPYIAPVVASPCIGPFYLPQKTGREKYLHALGETCSLTDRIFHDKSSLPLLPQDHKFPNPLIAASLPSTEAVIYAYRDMIQEHVKRRILFFFQQLIACYKTKLHFEMSCAQDQGASADKIQVCVKGILSSLSSRQAAHSSTIPCLIAYDKKAWEQSQAENTPPPTGFVFLKGTHYYRTANATMNMPKWINDADREIDEKTKDSQLREKGLKLIRLSAEGHITPDRGLLQFLQEGLDEILSAQARLQSQDKKPEVGLVLKLYEEFFRKMQQDIQENPKFFEQFLNTKLSSDQKSTQTILQMRYKAIRDAGLHESALIQKIHAVKTQALADIKGIGKKPSHFEGAFRTALISQATTLLDRQRLEKLLHFSPYDFEAKLGTPAQKTLFTKISAQLVDPTLPHLSKIKGVSLEILQDMRHLRTEETYLRADVIKELRGLKGWSQKQLGEELKNLFPLASASPSTICRIENRNKLVTPALAEEFSRVFNIDPGLLMPHFFYD